MAIRLILTVNICVRMSRWKTSEESDLKHTFHSKQLKYGHQCYVCVLPSTVNLAINLFWVPPIRCPKQLQREQHQVNSQVRAFMYSVECWV